MDSLPPRTGEAMLRQKEVGGRKNRQKPGNLREQVNPESMEVYHKANGLWPTPSSQEAGKITPDQIEGEPQPNQRLYSKKTGNHMQVTLGRAVTLWPTPRANDAEKRGQVANNPRNGLPAAVLWPTPSATDHKGSGTEDATPRDRLDYAAEQGITKSKLYPTPDVGAAKGRGKSSAEKRNRLGGTLNPQWVEWLMGYPEGWTDLSNSETPSSPKSQK
jgi:hypothetical protein